MVAGLLLRVERMIMLLSENFRQAKIYLYQLALQHVSGGRAGGWAISGMTLCQDTSRQPLQVYRIVAIGNGAVLPI